MRARSTPSGAHRVKLQEGPISPGRTTWPYPWLLCLGPSSSQEGSERPCPLRPDRARNAQQHGGRPGLAPAQRHPIILELVHLEGTSPKQRSADSNARFIRKATTTLRPRRSRAFMRCTSDRVLKFNKHRSTKWGQGS